MSPPTADADRRRPADLDDLEAVAALDPHDALGTVERAATQWRDALERGAGATAPLDVVDHVLVCGMGGSGIVADVARAIAQPVFDLPVVTHKGPGLPSWVGAATLVLAVSHSGNTAETVDATGEALRRGCPVVGVTSGGRLERLLSDAGQPVLDVPPGGQPRHSTGSLLVPVLESLGLAAGVEAAIDRLASIAATCGRDVPMARNPAKRLAVRLAGADAGVPALYGTAGIGEVAAYRLRCQLAENAKMRSWHHAVPEMAHNDVVAFVDTATAGAALWLREDAELGDQLALLGELFGDAFAWQERIDAEGDTAVERYVSLTGFLDLVSVYTALARGIDPTPIEPIERVKAAMRQ